MKSFPYFAAKRFLTCSKSGISAHLGATNTSLATPSYNSDDLVTALQILAAKPYAFPTGSKLGFWQRIFYIGIPVNEEKHWSPLTKPSEAYQSCSDRKQQNKVSFGGSARSCEEGCWTWWLALVAWLVLKNGVEVKLQRNALSVHEHPTGNEVDTEFDFDSNSSSDIGERENDFRK